MHAPQGERIREKWLNSSLACVNNLSTIRTVPRALPRFRLVRGT